MSEALLPKGWSSVITTEAFDLISTTKKKVKTKDCLVEGLYPVIDQGQDKIAGYVNDYEKVIEVVDPLLIFGDHTRVIKWVDKSFVPGADGTKILKPKHFLHPRFSYYQMRAIELPDKGYSRHFKFLKEIDFFVPPLKEQTRIANKLDELIAQVNTIKGRVDAIPHILKRFRQSVLSAAVSGKLTEEWRRDTSNYESSFDLKIRWLNEREERFLITQQELVAEGKQKRVKKFKKPVPADLEFKIPDVPNEWELISVSEFAECLDGQRVPVKKELRASAKGLYPYFGANGEVDKVDDYIFDCELVLVTEDETFYGRTKPIAYRYSGKCWVNNHVHALNAPTKTANDFLCFTLMFYDVIPWLTGTTGRAKLTQGALNSLPIGLPPEKEQEQIAQKVDQLFAFADQIEQRVIEAQASIDNLSQSILAKAFRGELVPQDPSDEPARVLLERVKQEREEAAKLAKLVKKAGKKAIKAV